MHASEIGQLMEELAALAQKDALSRGIQLDFSEASLDKVDEVLDMIAPGDVITPQFDKEREELWLVSKIYGGYIGQVVIEVMGGRWELESLEDGQARAVLRHGDIRMFPIQNIYKRLTEEFFSGVSGYCRGLRLVVEETKKRPAD